MPYSAASVSSLGGDPLNWRAVNSVPALVALYANLNRMRILSSKPVVQSAEEIAKTMMDTYLESDKSFIELRDMVKSGNIDLLRKFSEACREEFDEMRDQQL